MENVTLSSPISELDFDTVLSQTEWLIGCGTARHKRQTPGMEWDDLKQDARLKLWQDYEFFVKDRPTMHLKEFIQLAKYAINCRCLDAYRKYYGTEKRSVHKIIDLDSMMNSLEEDCNLSFVEMIADKRSNYGILELENQDLMNYLRSQLSEIEHQILENLMKPSDRLCAIMQAECLPVEQRTAMLEEKILKVLNTSCPNPRKRQTNKVPLWHISVDLEKPYNEVRDAFQHLRQVVSTVLFQERVTAGLLA